MIDVLVVGAGTAGLSAGVYAAREGLDTLVLEQTVYGGQIVNSPMIQNYPGIKEISGYEFATGLYEQAIEAGAKIQFSKVEQVIKVDGKQPSFQVIAGETVYEAKTVIIATGAASRQLGIDREKELIGRGLSYCATCDGAFFRGKKVAVNGGGNTAVMDAIFLAAYCEKVYLIHRRKEFRAEQGLLEQAETLTNIEFITDATIEKLEGDDTLQGLALQYKNEKTAYIEVEGLFVAIGRAPETKAFQTLIDLDQGGYVVAGEDCNTSVDGVFAAGDCRKKEVRQLTTAAADGAVAALAAAKYIKM